MRLRFLIVLLLTAGSSLAQSDDICVLIGNATTRCDIPIPEDTLLYIENRGVTRLLINLNGFDFKLASDPDEVTRSGNAFPFPREGGITINIKEYILPEDNVIEFTPQGPADSTIPQVVIANVLIVGETVAYAIEGLQPLPEQLDLLQSYPNPFRASTTLTYTIPESRTTGLPVRVVIYDTAGRRVRVLVDDRRYPGTFEVPWDGRTAAGTPVASGLYLAHLTAGEVQASVKLTRLR